MNTPARKTLRLSGHFLALDVYEQPSGECRGDVVYVESPTTRTTILTETYPSLNVLIDMAVKGAATLIERARSLCPAIGLRESAGLALMKALPFKPRDVNCEKCGVDPGESCEGSTPHESRAETLQHFLIWLAEQSVATPMTTQRIRDVVTMMGYSAYSRDSPVVIEQSSTGKSVRIYVGGRMDSSKSVWMTSSSNLSDPERGPFRNPIELALAVRAWSRGE